MEVEAEETDGEEEEEEEEEQEEAEPIIIRYALRVEWVGAFQSTYTDPAQRSKKYLYDWPYVDGVYARLLPGQGCPNDAVEVVFRCPQSLAFLAWPDMLRVFDPLTVGDSMEEGMEEMEKGTGENKGEKEEEGEIEDIDSLDL